MFRFSTSSFNSPLTLFRPSSFNFSSSPRFRETCGINQAATKNANAASAAPTMKIIRNPFLYAGTNRERIRADSDSESLER